MNNTPFNVDVRHTITRVSRTKTRHDRLYNHVSYITLVNKLSLSQLVYIIIELYCIFPYSHIIMYEELKS